MPRSKQEQQQDNFDVAGPQKEYPPDHPLDKFSQHDQVPKKDYAEDVPKRPGTGNYRSPRSDTET